MPNDQTMTQMTAHAMAGPDTTVDVRTVFGLDVNMTVPAFSEGSDYVPDIDESYQFDHDTTLAILAGFGHNRRVMSGLPAAPANPPISNRWPHA